MRFYTKYYPFRAQITPGAHVIFPRSGNRNYKHFAPCKDEHVKSSAGISCLFGDNDHTLSQMKCQVLFNIVDDVWRYFTRAFWPVQPLGL